jgi:hypothetical protein
LVGNITVEEAEEEVAAGEGRTTLDDICCKYTDDSFGLTGGGGDNGNGGGGGGRESRIGGNNHMLSSHPSIGGGGGVAAAAPRAQDPPSDGSSDQASNVNNNGITAVASIGSMIQPNAAMARLAAGGQNIIIHTPNHHPVAAMISAATAAGTIANVGSYAYAGSNHSLPVTSSAVASSSSLPGNELSTNNSGLGINNNDFEASSVQSAPNRPPITPSLPPPGLEARQPSTAMTSSSSSLPLPAPSGATSTTATGGGAAAIPYLITTTSVGSMVGGSSLPSSPIHATTISLDTGAFLPTTTPSSSSTPNNGLLTRDAIPSSTPTTASMTPITAQALVEVKVEKKLQSHESAALARSTLLGISSWHAPPSSTVNLPSPIPPPSSLGGNRARSPNPAASTFAPRVSFAGHNPLLSPAGGKSNTLSLWSTGNGQSGNNTIASTQRDFAGNGVDDRTLAMLLQDEHKYQQRLVEHIMALHVSREMARWWSDSKVRTLGWRYLFTFPSPTNEAEVRVHALCVITLVPLHLLMLRLYSTPVIGWYIFAGFLLRTIAGPRFDPQAHIILFLLRPILVDRWRLWGTKWYPGPPRRFAQVNRNILDESMFHYSCGILWYE